MQVLLSAFVNTRTRMQRLRDAKFYYGWIKELTNVNARAILNNNPTIDIGDKFLVEVHGKEKVAIFQAQVSGHAGDDVLLTVIGNVDYRDATESARVSVANVSGVADHDGLEIEIVVQDVSANGMGVIAAQPMRKGTRIRSILHTAFGEIQCTGEVRHAKPDADQFGRFRVGIALDEFDRLASARWKRLYDSAL